jgi:hypothetical protein
MSLPTRSLIALVFPLVLASLSIAQQPPNIEQLLTSGKLVDAEKTLTTHLTQQPADDQARFELGVVQFLKAIETLSQSLYRHGARTEFGAAALPLMEPGNTAWVNPKPEKLNYAGARKIVQRWLDDLTKAEATLAQIKSDKVKLPLHVGLIRLDFNGDGQAKDEEALWRVYHSLADLNTAQGEIDTGGPPNEKDPNKAEGEIELGRAGCDDKADPAEIKKNEQQAQSFIIAFDAGDVHWLRGYCHILMAVGEIILAHDTQDIFERTAHLFFTNVETPHAWVKEQKPRPMDVIGPEILDGIAFLHLIRLEVKEPQRMQKALGHFKSMVRSSRESWKLILAETDDEREWIPNPNQKTVIPETKVSPEMVKSWHTFLDEADQILDGKKLIPFWRSVLGVGVNIRRVFTEPKTLDLVLWVQGTAATPYLEKGPITSPDIWRGITASFGEDFLSYAFWFN